MYRLFDFLIEFIFMVAIAIFAYFVFSFIFVVVHRAISTGEYASIKIFFSVVMLFVCYAYIRVRIERIKQSLKQKPNQPNNPTKPKKNVSYTTPTEVKD